MGAKILSELEVPDLARRQAVQPSGYPRPNKKMSRLVGCPTLPGQIEMRRFHPSVISGAVEDIRVVRQDEMVALGLGPLEVCHATKFSSVGDFVELSETSLGVLTYLTKMGDLLSISMLGVAEEKPTTSLKPTEKTRPPDEPEPWEE